MENLIKERVFSEYLYCQIIKDGIEKELTPDFISTAVLEGWKLKLKSIYSLPPIIQKEVTESLRERRLLPNSWGETVGLEYTTDKPVSSESRNHNNCRDAMISYVFRSSDGCLKSDWFRISDSLSVPMLKAKGYDMGSYWLGFGIDVCSTVLGVLITN